MLEHTKDHARNHLIIRVLYATGIRNAELRNLLVADLDFSTGRLFVRAGKGDKDRYVLMDPDTLELLAEYTQGFPLEEPIFDISDATVNRAVKKAAKELGIHQRYKAIGRTFTAHSLRHACATHLYEAGMDPFQIKNLLGHHFLSTTLKYVHISLHQIAESYQAKHPLNKTL